MQTSRPWPLLIAGAATLPLAAWSAGFGPGGTGALLGQPLDFVTVLRLEPGDTIGPECISAEVTVGDRRLPAGLVRTSLEMQGRDAARVRVSTTSAIDEPVVGVQLHAGCLARVSRRYVVLADPPVQQGMTAQTAQAAQTVPGVAAPAYAAALPELASGRAGDGTATAGGMAPQGNEGSAAAAPLTMGSAAGAAGTAGAASTTRSAAAAPRDAGRPAPTTEPAANDAPATRAQRRTEARRAAAADRVEGGRAARSANAAAVRRVALAAPAAAPPPAAPRLRLEAAEPKLSAAALTGATTAAALAATANANSATANAVTAKPTMANSTSTSTASAEALAVEQALQAVQQAMNAARASAAGASAAEARIASLERSVASLRADAQSSRDTAVSLREQLARAEGASFWFWPVLVVALLLLAAAGWMARRLAVAQRTQQIGWNNATAAQAPRNSRMVGGDTQSASGFGPSQNTVQSTAAMPMGFQDSRQPRSPQHMVAGDAKLPGAAAADGRSAQAGNAIDAAVVGLATAPSRSVSPPAWPAAAPADPWQPSAQNSGRPASAGSAASGATAFAALPTVVDVLSPMNSAVMATRPLSNAQHGQRTQQNPGGLGAARADAAAPRDVSIEELIDLEQQAEFFVVLGQDEAAIDLLVEHLRNTGGGSPLPYLKLLEIHRRRGDRADYERTRTRFNHRFNAYAPDWGVELSAGRSLEDYPGVIPRLQQVWARPLDAMAEMEALLFRKLRGELFDLPAYRDVLFLYSLARDLLDREAADTGNVDLLLPLADGSDFSSTAPAPYLGLERELDFSHDGFDDRPTAPVDFDLSVEPDRTTSIFDSLDNARDGGLPVRPR